MIRQIKLSRYTELYITLLLILIDYQLFYPSVWVDQRKCYNLSTHSTHKTVYLAYANMHTNLLGLHYCLYNAIAHGHQMCW